MSGQGEMAEMAARAGAGLSSGYVGLYVLGVEVQAWAAIGALFAALCTAAYYLTKTVIEIRQHRRRNRRGG